MSILVVDDYEPARFLRQRVLESAGYDVRLATSVSAAYSIAHAEPDVQLVLLDLQLPDGDGWSLCERLKVELPALPVVIITALYKSATARLEAFSAGADAYLVEPTSSARLLDTIAQSLGQERKETTARARVYTAASGTIIGVDPPGARLLNISARGALGRNLMQAFASDRPSAIASLRAAASGQVVQGEAVIRPRERKPLKVGYEAAQDPDDPDSIVWLFDVRDSLPARH